MNSLEALEILAIQREGGIVESATKDVGFNQGPSEDDGTGLTGPLLPFDKLTRLQKLYLGVNSLSGTIPSNFLDGILDKRDNIEVDLISNRLTGDLPASLARFESLTIYVAGNEISGIPDGLCRQESWMNGAVGIYDCDGILCPPGFFSKYGRSADASSECSPCPSGTSAFYGSFVCSNEEETSRMDEREVLEELYRATSGHSWRMKDSWMDPDVSVCQWAGVSCTENGNVESIHLMRNGLTGQVPSSIYDLEYLKELNVAGNLEVEMTFDGIEAATRLEYINLDSTGLGSLAGIESASNLKLLHVADNRLDTFPLEVLLLTNLEVLYMSENNLGGSLPSEINALSNLVFFACSQCGFEGSMPSSVGQLTNLEFLELDQNEFYGSLPSTIQNLQRLKHLDLSRQLSNGQVVSLASQSSSTTEAGFEGPLPSFSNLTQLTELYLFTNRFSGEIPDEFMQYNGERGPVTVDLRRNRLSGTVPSSLSQYQSLNFYVSENMITGVPTELCSLSWNDKRSSVVDCDFILCAAGTFNGLGRATSDLPCESCTEAGYSAYMGSTSCGPDLERQILDELYRDLGGPQWTNSEGWADGGSVCSRYGVECDEKGLVRVLDLHNNNLFGIVSSRIWLLTRMRVLNLSQNHVDVTFDKIADAESLTGLSLSQTNLRYVLTP